MILFLLKGLIRDRSRSLFPVLVITTGVFITVFAYGWINGINNSFLDSSARFETGHVKIMTRAYAADRDQYPNDLAFNNITTLMTDLRREYPQFYWTPRTKFAGLLDIPDENGETKKQAAVLGFAVDMISSENIEIQMLNLDKALTDGVLPAAAHEMLISAELAEKLDVAVDDRATFISSTVHGSMALQDFIITGFVSFGISALDNGAVICDLSGVQNLLDMPDGSAEILGFFKTGQHNYKGAADIRDSFNKKYSDSSDDFAPEMLALQDQNGLDSMILYLSYMGTIVISLFVFVMSLVLWNTGLMGSLRRYGEIGIRLAMGESKAHVYKMMIVESILIGLGGSLMGTALGLSATYYLQVVGFDISEMTRSISVMMTNVIRARISPECFYMGFVPGLMATVIGTTIAGLGIFKRETAQLFKELEV
ncbi:MAG: ABC transporter permease [FCB group bacterium]|nr:ABC transporter permease [FCB group bacterium]